MSTLDHAAPVTGGADPAGGFVVVGVSGSSGSPMAVRWAFDAARTWGLRLVAVSAYRAPATAAGPARPTPSRVAGAGDVLRDAAHDELERHLRAVLGEGDAARVELRVVKGGRRRVLVEASDGAAMLVIDAPRSRELSADPVFARRLLHRAHCPVVVMPPQVSGSDAEPWVRGRRSPRA